MSIDWCRNIEEKSKKQTKKKQTNKQTNKEVRIWANIVIYSKHYHDLQLCIYFLRTRSMINLTHVNKNVE